MREFIINRKDLVPGAKFVSKSDATPYTLTHVSKETVIFEDEGNQEYSATIIWVVDNWVRARDAAQTWAWHCPTCKAMEKKVYDAALKKCSTCQTQMKVVYVMEVPGDDALYQEYRKLTDEYYYDLMILFRKDPALLQQMSEELTQFLRERRRTWRKKVPNIGSTTLRPNTSNESQSLLGSKTKEETLTSNN